MVIQVHACLAPLKLLAATQQIEQKCGRERDIRWGPRTLDLDILLFDDENIELESLCIPHPRMWERAFVMVPLLELKPSLEIERIDQSLTDKKGVRMWMPKTGVEKYGPFGN